MFCCLKLFTFLLTVTLLKINQEHYFKKGYSYSSSHQADKNQYRTNNKAKKLLQYPRKKIKVIYMFLPLAAAQLGMHRN